MRSLMLILVCLALCLPGLCLADCTDGQIVPPVADVTRSAEAERPLLDRLRERRDCDGEECNRVLDRLRGKQDKPKEEDAGDANCFRKDRSIIDEAGPSPEPERPQVRLALLGLVVAVGGAIGVGLQWHRTYSK